MTDAIANLLAALAEVYPHPPMTAPRLAAYGLALGDLSDLEAERAFLVLAREPDRRFYPAPGEILAATRPQMTAGAIAALFDAIEVAVLFRRATMATITTMHGSGVADALRAAGGLDAVRGPAEHRMHRLREFAVALREVALLQPERLLPGATDATPTPVLQLVADVAARRSA